MASQIQLRRGTAAQWTSTNPILALGETGLETDTRKVKYGDGVTAWTVLDYAAGVSVESIPEVQAFLEATTLPNAQAAITPLLPDSTQTNNVTQLKCAAYQRVVLTKNAWNTVSTLTGSGSITKLWVAVAMAVAGDPIVRNTLIRIKFNGAATAQIGGSSDVTLEDFFCGGLGIDREFRSERIGISNNDVSNFGGHFKQHMPFTNGCTIELKPIGTTGTVWFYGMIQYTVGHFTSGMINRNWVLHVDTSIYNYVAFDPIDHVILNTGAATKLLGLNHRIDHSGAFDNVYLEHDYLISDDGGTTNFWTSSGTEDMFGGAFYFEQEPLYQDNDNGVICRPLDAGVTEFKFSGYMFWDNFALPSGDSQLKFSWSSVNDPASLPDVNLTSRATVFYYQES